MTGALITEALATLWALRDALLLWIVAGAAVLSVCGLGVVAGGVWMWQAARRRVRANLGPRKALSARLPASEPESDPASASASERRSEPRTSAAPSWAQTEPHETEQAA